MFRMLIIEDEVTIRHGIKAWFSKSKFEIVEAADGRVALELLKNESFDIVLLDLMVPYHDGFEILHYIKNEISHWVPVIMLTARADEEDKILGLNLGADDYVTKPFSNRELEARINAQLRNKKYICGINNHENDFFDVNIKNHTIAKGNKEVLLSSKEMDLLILLIENKDILMEKDKLLQMIWGIESEKNTRTLDTHVSKIRKKLESIGVVDMIETKRSRGYMYTERNV